MKFNYKPKSKLEKFGLKVYSALVENFSQTFFVGGMVRDLLLKREVTDIDIATEARPDEVIKVLSKVSIDVIDSNKKFGVVVAKQGAYEIEIATFRKDIQTVGRYPKVQFINSPKIDSKRRDFTINSLYLSQKLGKIYSFQKGLDDIKLKQIKFIGNPKKRILEDPLRIVRALRFVLVLNFKLEKNIKKSIKENFSAVNNLTKSRIEKEINKIKNKSGRNLLKVVIDNPNLLDKFFK